jgi:hypothetical protein
MKHTMLLALLQYAFVPATTLFLAGCGTTGPLKATPTASLQSIQKYAQVSVLDFSDKTPQKGKPDDPASAQHDQQMIEHGRHFSDLIALELSKTQVFEKVNRVDKPQPGTLVVSGDITRCSEGNAALRLWIGLGAGSSYFDAIVRASDADTGQPIGEIEVDKNSWGGGGALAAGQTVQSFMEGAAKKVAAQLSKARAGAAVAKQ